MPPFPGYRQGVSRLKDALLQQADRASESLFRHPIARRMRKEMYGKDWDTSKAFYAEVKEPKAWQPPPQDTRPTVPVPDVVKRALDAIHQNPASRAIRRFANQTTEEDRQIEARQKVAKK